MSQNLIHVSLVMCFYKQYKSEITNFLAHNQDKSIYFGETDEYFILVFNEADVPNFEVWLAETMKLVDYHNNVAFYKLVDNINKISTKIPVICFHAGYNKNCIGNNIIRCYSWYDIYSKINSIK